MSRLLGLVVATLVIAGFVAAGGAVPSSGIAGRVLEAPTCPVQRVPPDPRCAPRPLAATLRIRMRGGPNGVVVRSRADGRFRVHLAPGTYVVQPLGQGRSPFPRPPGPRVVRVRAARFTNITITYDTGIR